MNQTKQSNNHSQINTKLMIFENKQQSPNPEEPKSSFSLARLMSKICPCVYFGQADRQSETESNTHQETKQDLNKKNTQQHQTIDFRKDDLVTVETLIGEGNRKNSVLFSSLHERNQKLEEENLTKTTVKKWHLYPVSSLQQNQLLIIGNENQKILCRIKTVLLHSNPQLKNMAKKSKLTEALKHDHSYGQSYIDKYWGQRYSLFAKFDEGISINDSSWPVIVPEVVSDHVASQVKCDTVANVCCGVGGDAIKLANTCNKVYAWDCNANNLRCLHINSKVYSVENIELIDYPQKIKNLQPQVVVVSSYSKLEQQCLNAKETSCEKMNPNLSSIIKKALVICPNIVLILPANININQLASIIVKYANQLEIIAQTCCLKMQKIYYASQFKHLIVYFGNHVSKSIAINDQLLWIYNYLNLDVVRWKADRKFIKKLREAYGMIRLLNFVLEANKRKDGDPMYKLYAYAKENKLLTEDKVRKYEEQKGKQLEEQKQEAKQAEHEEQKQKTISQVSMPSILNRLSADQLNIDIENGNTQYDPYKSVPMQGATKSLFKPKSVIRSIGVEGPAVPRMSIRDSRESDVTSFKYLN